MTEILLSEPVISVLVQLPMVAIMGVIMLGMRQDLRDLRGDLKDCNKAQSEMLESLIQKVIKPQE